MEMRRWSQLLLTAALIAGPAEAAEQLRLVVQITFDQLRGDLLERYRPALNGGLRRVMDDGWRVERGEAAHGITVSWPGPGTLATGLYPSHHGWTANEWWIEVGGKWQEVDAASDGRYRELGREDHPGRSTARMLAPRIGDWLQGAAPMAQGL